MKYAFPRPQRLRKLLLLYLFISRVGLNIVLVFVDENEAMKKSWDLTVNSRQQLQKAKQLTERLFWAAMLRWINLIHSSRTSDDSNSIQDTTGTLSTPQISSRSLLHRNSNTVQWHGWKQITQIIYNHHCGLQKSAYSIARLSPPASGWPPWTS